MYSLYSLLSFLSFFAKHPLRGFCHQRGTHFSSSPQIVCGNGCELVEGQHEGGWWI